MKKTTKLVITALLVVAMVFTMVGCGKKKEAKSTSVKSDNVESQLEGKLVSFSGKDLVMTGEDDSSKQYSFDVSKAKIDSKNMVAGDDIVVLFNGEIKGTDTSKATVEEVKDKSEKATSHKEETAVGTLVDITKNTITIKENDGTELKFNIANAEQDFKNGLREGNWVVVTYVGTINGTDTSNVKVVKVTDDDANTVEKAQKEMEIKAVNETVYATAGVHVRKSYTTDSDILGSLAKGDSITRTGICDNGWSRVEYNGEDGYIYGDYLTTTAPAADAAPAKTSGAQPATPQNGNQPAPVQTPTNSGSGSTDSGSGSTDSGSGSTDSGSGSTDNNGGGSTTNTTPQTLTGTVQDASMNTISVAEDGTGTVYTFSVIDAAHNYKNGIQTGNKVTVTYTGDLSDMSTVVVSTVEDDDPNTAAQASTYTGSIVDGTTNTLTIQTDDGAQVTFDKTNATDNTGGLTVGNRVTVTADSTATADGSNLITATQIDPAQS